VSSLQIALDEPLSPELALVCPELAERARRLLPDPGKPVHKHIEHRHPLHALGPAVAALLITVTPLMLLVMVAPHIHH
jgi:hypothetical protein